MTTNSKPTDLLANLARGIDTKTEFGDTRTELAEAMVRGMRHQAAFYPRAVAAVAQDYLDQSALLDEARRELREVLDTFGHRGAHPRRTLAALLSKLGG